MQLSTHVYKRVYIFIYEAGYEHVFASLLLFRQIPTRMQRASSLVCNLHTTSTVSKFDLLLLFHPFPCFEWKKLDEIMLLNRSYCRNTISSLTFSNLSISSPSRLDPWFSFHSFKDGLIILPYRLQTEAGWGEDPRGKDTCLLGETQEGGSGVARHVSHMPENQVRRRRRSHLQLLQHPVLRTLRRKGHFTVDQGRGEIGKETARYIIRRNRALSSV